MYLLPGKWDFLSVKINSRKTAEQKLNYFNPVSVKWKLSKDDLSYYYSSARFYEYGIDDFLLLNNLFEAIDG